LAIRLPTVGKPWEERGGVFLSSLGGGGTELLKVWERGRENGSFPVEEGLGNREVSQEQIPFATPEEDIVTGVNISLNMWTKHSFYAIYNVYIYSRVYHEAL